MTQFVIAALYKFVLWETFKEARESLLQVCREAGIRGTLLLAQEGINGTIAGSREGIDTLRAYLQKDPRFQDLEYKESFAETLPFYRLKIRLKKEIVTLGVPDVNPTQRVGVYVEPQEWNQLLQDPDVLVLDTRNVYEVAIGKFKGAHDPRTETFRQFPEFVKKNLDPKKHQKVAMYCTGGIRCEKASSYMLGQGFSEVYHLKGGILKYLETIPQDQSLWEGQCFVFDHRTAVKDGVTVGHFQTCYGCRYPLSPEDQKSDLFVPGVSCPYCHPRLTERKRKRLLERQRQCALSREKGHRHLGNGEI